jgi:ketosteroid isomerase-like protein
VPTFIKREEFMSDLDDLKATAEQANEAQGALDLKAWSTLWHDQLVDFPPFLPFMVEGKAAVRQMFEALWANTESLNVRQINPQYRVIGSTGLVWGQYVTEFKPKKAPLQRTTGRFTATYVKTDGKWLLVSRHVSLLPTESESPNH